jgi:hypothetical protein
MQFYELRAHPYTFHAIVQTPKRGIWRIQIGDVKTCVIFNIEEGNESCGNLLTMGLWGHPPF